MTEQMVADICGAIMFVGFFGFMYLIMRDC
jgi:hypothetical protein